jgi:hypothetical protein
MPTDHSKHFRTRWRRRSYLGTAYQGQIRWWAGYDCRVKCEHAKKGNHGQRGDEFCLVVRLIQEEAALDLFCHTYARDGQVCSPSLAADQGLVTLQTVALHLPFPTSEEQVIAGIQSGCDILPGGSCYSTYGSSSWGEQLWTAAETIAAGDAVLNVPLHAKRFEALPIWDRLAQEVINALPKYKAESAALPRRCEHCKGKGLIAKKGKRP